MAQIQLSEHDIKKIEEDWDKEIEKDAKYWRENDAKLRAVTNVNSYEEFSEIVKAAHLQPLQRKEILEMHKKHTVTWNNAKICPDENKTTASTQPVTEIQVPTSPGGLVHTWNKIDSQSKLLLLKQIPLSTLAELLQVEAPPGMLGDIAGLLQPTSQLEELTWQAELLNVLTRSSRFSLNLKFLTTQEKESCKIIFENLNKVKNLQNIMKHICKEYNLK